MKRMRLNNFSVFLLVLLFSVASCKKEKAIVLDDLSSANQNINNQYLGAENIEALLELADTSTLSELSDLKNRLVSISIIFAEKNDARGTFPMFYRAISEEIINSGHQLNNQILMNKLIVAFGKRFLMNLYSHLVGRKPEYQWRDYYSLALGPKKILQTTLTGVNAHLSVDLARAVSDVKLSEIDDEDYRVFGDLIVDAQPLAQNYLIQYYNTDPSFVLGGLELGDAIDALFGNGATAALGIQLIREEAWNNGLELQKSENYNYIQTKIRHNYFEREDVLISLAKNSMLD